MAPKAFTKIVEQRAANVKTTSPEFRRLKAAILKASGRSWKVKAGHAVMVKAEDWQAILKLAAVQA